MGYIVNGKETFEMPEQGITFRYANPCSDMGGHEYAEAICPQCGRDFCYTCCSDTNVHEGGKYTPDFMECPACGHDIMDETEHITFRGIDDWNRPVFQSETKGRFFGSTDKLFPYNATKEDVLVEVNETDLVFFGPRFNCEPAGTPAGDIKIVKEDI